jgi:hypothetical protein
MAAWTEAVAGTGVGALPPMVTVTVSIDDWAFDGPVVAVLAVVMTSSPHCAAEPL